MSVDFAKVTILTVAAFASTSVCRLRAENSAETLQVEKGSAAFDVGTNIPAVRIHGESSKVEATARVRHDGRQLVLEQLEARMPVKTLGTGMGVRDDHMRKYIFETKDGKTPDLKFTASNLNCPDSHGAEVQCAVSGNLSIRGVERPFQITLKLREEGSSAHKFRAGGEGTVKLSDYGIERPSQFGVKTDDEVKLRLEFTGKAAPAVTAAAAGGAR